jgi:hypothetical protein
MATVTIDKAQYQDLKRKAAQYERIVATAAAELFAAPPTRDKKQVLQAFRGTKRYSPDFLKSLKKGLQRSRYFA